VVWIENLHCGWRSLSIRCVYSGIKRRKPLLPLWSPPSLWHLWTDSTQILCWHLWFLRRKSALLSALTHFLKLAGRVIAGWLAHYFERVSLLAATQNVIEPKMALESAEADSGHGDCVLKFDRASQWHVFISNCAVAVKEQRLGDGCCLLCAWRRSGCVFP
jgi:hypothetical protein